MKFEEKARILAKRGMLFKTPEEYAKAKAKHEREQRIETTVRCILWGVIAICLYVIVNIIIYGV